MKVGDLVVWMRRPGIILKTRPSVLGKEQGLSLLAYMPELPKPEWFSESELDLISEAR